ncbi:pentatricopeptide repeat-containing protein At5g50990 [Phalaenopsis equestris]|uniref:pentatricopeptide repeat-containing protein At5g50990 n=1 Tax=Phalaenopsis equestris TaxID=78828 RepID=UPI0009E41A06|nr:pentatricopeptide repeat-containing protein At5g50990 [Phalaenopsis equestris]
MLLALLSCRRQLASLTEPATCSTKCRTAKERLPSFCNSIIRSAIEKGSPTNAFLAFKSLHACGALRPDHRTLALLLQASTISPHLSNASEVHVWFIKLGLQWLSSRSPLLFQLYLSRDLLTDALQLLDEILDKDPDPFHGNLLIMSFLRKEDIDSSYKVFNRMPVRDKISWNSMITAAVRSSRPLEALSLYRRMMLAGVEPDCFSFSTALSACARAGALRNGQQIHQLMTEKETGFESNPFLCSALIDMYSKCGKIDIARRIFDSVKRFSLSVSIWNAMITGLAIHGRGSEALQVFCSMTKEAIFPDKITFVGILTACSHCGMVKEARFYFDSMQRDFSIKPQLEHYGAMVDALARAGQLDAAYEIIKDMPFAPDSAIWRALLGACRRNGRWDVAEMLMGKMKRCHSGDYVLLSSIYSSAKDWEKAEGVWRVMKENGVRKGKGLSWVEVDGRVLQFKAGDRSRRTSDDIYRVLGELMGRAKEEGYVPNTEVATKDVSEEEKEETLSSHSEKLAVAYCVMSNGGEGVEDIRVSKNLRTCWDCHEWMKVVCTVLGRVIIVRDRIRFHRFENGACSCGDYW